MKIELDGKEYNIVNIKFHDGKKVYYSAEQGFLDVGKGSLDRAEEITFNQIRKAVKVNLAKNDNFLIKEVPRYSYVMQGEKPRTVYIYAPDYEIVKDGIVTDYDDSRLSYQDVVKISLPDGITVYQQKWRLDKTRFDHQLVRDIPEPLNKIELSTRVTHSVLTDFGKEVSSLTELLNKYGVRTEDYNASEVIKAVIKHFNISEKEPSC
jgi:hypothetical protein